MLALIWCVTELLLNFLGLDEMADYSEFLWEKNRPDLQALV
ncbi:MAG: hypothetical protein ACRC8A_14380 [Microcoleaceae cyanobacterium]